MTIEKKPLFPSPVYTPISRERWEIINQDVLASMRDAQIRMDRIINESYLSPEQQHYRFRK